MTLNQMIERAKALVEENPATGDMEVFIIDDQGGSYEMGRPYIHSKDTYVEWGILADTGLLDKDAVVFPASN